MHLGEEKIMKYNNLNVDAFLSASTKTQAEVLGFSAKAIHFMNIHEAIQNGDYRSWNNAMHISENICGDENYYLRKFYKQMDNVIRACKKEGILNRIPETGSHKRALFREVEKLCNELLALAE